MAKKRKKEKKNKNVVIALFVMVGILALILIGLIMYSFGVFESNSPELFVIKDECGNVLGNLIHQIRDEGECRIKCVNECDVRGMDFFDFGFALKIDDCNSCECWCN
jgi:ethanolamine utilization protein EutA (predicted chaperonin)